MRWSRMLGRHGVQNLFANSNKFNLQRRLPKLSLGLPQHLKESFGSLEERNTLQTFNQFKLIFISCDNEISLTRPNAAAKGIKHITCINMLDFFKNIYFRRKRWNIAWQMHKDKKDFEYRCFTINRKSSMETYTVIYKYMYLLFWISIRFISSKM